MLTTIKGGPIFCLFVVEILGTPLFYSKLLFDIYLYINIIEIGTFPLHNAGKNIKLIHRWVAIKIKKVIIFF